MLGGAWLPSSLFLFERAVSDPPLILEEVASVYTCAYGILISLWQLGRREMPKGQLTSRSRKYVDVSTRDAHSGVDPPKKVEKKILVK